MLCVMMGSSAAWSPIKVSNYKSGSSGFQCSDDSDLDSDDCLSKFEYQPRDGVPGCNIETNDDGFWAPIAHRTGDV